MKFKIFSILMVGLLAACTSEYGAVRVDEFTLEQGGYMRTVLPFPVRTTTFNVSKANLTGSKWEFLAEAVTPNSGDNFASYDWVVRFVDETPKKGPNSVADRTFKTWQASSFTKDAKTGYPRATLGSTGRELLTAVGLTEAQIAVGDIFEVRSTITLKDGRKFTFANTGANITGGAFYSSPFLYSINVVL